MQINPLSSTRVRTTLVSGLIFIAGCSSFGIRTNTEIVTINASAFSRVTLTITGSADGAEMENKVPIIRPSVDTNIGDLGSHGSQAVHSGTDASGTSAANGSGAGPDIERTEPSE